MNMDDDNDVQFMLLESLLPPSSSSSSMMDNTAADHFVKYDVGTTCDEDQQEQTNQSQPAEGTFLKYYRQSFFFILGSLIGIISASVGLYLLQHTRVLYTIYKASPLYENDSMASWSIQQQHQQKQQMYYYCYILAVSFVIALIWSLITVFVSYMSYLLLSGRSSIQFLNNNKNVVSHKKHNHCVDDIDELATYYDQDIDQIMITMGTCVGFTVMCLL